MKTIAKLIKILWRLLTLILLWQAILRIIRRYFKFPAPWLIGRILDSDYRRRLQPPGQLINRSGIQTGMKILEIGPGSGAYTTFAARKVGEKGYVYALDIQPEMLAQLQAKLDLPENRDIHNIDLINRSASDLPFENDSLDVVYMVTVFQEIPGKQQILKEIMRVLKPGGFLAISEFLPDPDYPWMGTTAQMGLKAGFLIDAMEGNLWTYTVRFKKGF